MTNQEYLASLKEQVVLCAAVAAALRKIEFGLGQRLTQDQHDKAMLLIEQLKEVLA